MKYHNNMKTTMLAVALGLVTFNASADWGILNGYCQTVTDNGFILVGLKAESITVLGQSPCRNPYDMRHETIAINGKPYPALGFCNGKSGFKPISVIAKSVNVTNIFADMATQEHVTLAALGGAGTILNGNFVQTCSKVLPSLTTTMTTPPQNSLDMNVVLSAAKQAYLKKVGDEDEAGSADWGSVKQLPDSKYKGQVVHVIQYEVYNAPYKSYDDVTVFVADDGRVINTEVKSR
ncbi:hypothetical protein RDT67_06800 [Serratia fonticola]|uniref:Uncharacterized protein n=1 Tax=Serratia fonticola TaxID=47917 RepID=A0AAJ1YDP6_SERFO|nr:hypothetical protein [Serratia fonticola]MDQ9126139.1 hypothetical protein [Serratia fonticola]